MTKRSYRQHCALACALDRIGERWTLLLIRELLTGPKRYSELLANLPGMGTNLLAARLKDLESDELIERRDGAYALTSLGEELDAAVVALCRFGARYLNERREEDLWRAGWNVLALRYAFRPERARDLRCVIEFRIDDSVVQAHIEDGEIETSGETSWSADAVLTTDGATFLELGRGELDLAAAKREGRVQVEGDGRLLARSLRAFAAGAP